MCCSSMRWRLRDRARCTTPPRRSHTGTALSGCQRSCQASLCVRDWGLQLVPHTAPRFHFALAQLWVPGEVLTVSAGDGAPEISVQTSLPPRVPLIVPAREVLPMNQVRVLTAPPGGAEMLLVQCWVG